jgi:SHS2 domain-containing protein
MSQRYESLEHTADIGFRAWGSSLEELFANAALALVNIAVDASAANAAEPYPFAAGGANLGEQLVNWLNEVLFWLDARRVVFARFEVQAPGQGVGWGEPRDDVKHPPRLVVKAVTFHQLKIEQTSEGWFAEVYLDI